MQGDPSLKRIFDPYAESSSGTVGDLTIQEQPHTDDGLDPEIKPKFDNIVKTDGLQHALLELGAPLEKVGREISHSEASAGLVRMASTQQWRCSVKV